MKCIAIHLPQFHPIPENDRWWGAGFTEWTNVTKAKPLYSGHVQPKLPADLGFVDMRVPEVRQAQADMARAHGIGGFCYYHYWFEGHRLLHKPVDAILKDGQPDFPFSLCWANESWSRRWLGENKEFLIQQTYSDEDHRRHAHWLSVAFADHRYTRIRNKPMFLIYRPMDIPDVRRALDIYREVVLREVGCELFLVGVDGHRSGTDFREHGFDYSMNFRPQLGWIDGLHDDGFNVRRATRNMKFGTANGHLRLIEYQEFVNRMQAKLPKHQHYFPSAFVGWDNTARRGKNGIVVLGGTPALFKRQLEQVIEVAQSRPPEEQIFFVNAWNEWAEGNYLEPDQRTGLKYLEVLKELIG